MGFSSIAAFLAGLLFSVVLIVILLLIGVPYARAPRACAAPAESSIRAEDDESAEWANALLRSVYAKLDLGTELPDILQRSFDESFRSDPANIIQKITVVNTEVGGAPPVLERVRSVREADGCARVTLGVKFNADIAIDMDVECSIPFLGVRTLGLIARVTRVDGFASVFVPREEGAIVITLQDGTALDVNIDMGIGQTAVGTSTLGPVWDMIQSVLISIMKRLPIRVYLPWEKPSPAPQAPEPNIESSLECSTQDLASTVIDSCTALISRLCVETRDSFSADSDTNE